MRSLLVLLAIFNLSVSQESKPIIQRISAHQIYEGYNILPTDSIINFENKKFLIHQIEDYRNGKLMRVSVWKPLGYLDFSEKNVLASKKFLDNHDLCDTLCFAEKSKEKVVINGKTYYSKKKEENRWYLETKPKKGKLYILVYE